MADNLSYFTSDPSPLGSRSAASPPERDLLKGRGTDPDQPPEGEVTTARAGRSTTARGTCCTANADGSGNPERIIFTVEQQEEYNDKNPPWPQRPKRCDTCRQAKNASVLANNAVVAAAAPGLGLGVNPPSPTWTIIPASSNSRHPDQIYIESEQVVRVCLFLNTASSVAASLFLFAFWRKHHNKTAAETET